MKIQREHPKNINAIAGTLKKRYQDFSHNNKKNPLNELIFIISSVKTTGSSYENTYIKFRKKFPSFEKIASAKTSEIEKVLSGGGLQKIKAKYLKNIFTIIIKRFGKPTLVALKKMDNKECETFLVSLPGVGKKVARCVMMYSLGRNVFPVDTHCWRICKRIGWLDKKKIIDVISTTDMDVLQSIIPVDLRYSLHVNFVSLGREFCKFNRPVCERCPIKRWCDKVGVLHN